VSYADLDYMRRHLDRLAVTATGDLRVMREISWMRKSLETTGNAQTLGPVPKPGAHRRRRGETK